jgi:cysteine desulfurase
LKSGDFLFGNPSSQHQSGKSSRKLINSARSKIYETFSKNEKDHTLFYHSGATESFYTYAQSFAEDCRLKGKNLLICFSNIDHPAVTSLEERFFGPHVKFFHLKRDERTHYLHGENLTSIRDKKENDPDLVILYHHLWVHNETGFVSPLGEITRYKDIPDLFIHVDSVQAPGKISDWRELSEGDIWSFSGHKFGALKGTGFTLMKKTIPFHPLFTGGGQQGNLRSGTENPMAAHALALALRDIEEVDVVSTKVKVEKIREELRVLLKGKGNILFEKEMASNTIYFYLNSLTSDLGLALFDTNGIMISAGSACSSGSAKESKLLLAMGLKDVARNGLRISFPLDDSEIDEKEIIYRFSEILNRV